MSLFCSDVSSGGHRAGRRPELCLVFIGLELRTFAPVEIVFNGRISNRSRIFCARKNSTPPASSLAREHAVFFSSVQKTLKIARSLNDLPRLKKRDSPSGGIVGQQAQAERILERSSISFGGICADQTGVSQSKSIYGLMIDDLRLPRARSTRNLSKS